MKHNEFKIRKIELFSFINLLIDVYETGASFVDIVGRPSGGQDIMKLVVQDEYIDYADVLDDDINFNDIIA